MESKQPNFFDNVNPFGQYNHRNVEDYLVDSSESGNPKNITNIKWDDGPKLHNVVQSGIGDCWLISSIQSLFDVTKKAKENIKRIFKHVVVNKQGNPEWVVLKLYPIKLHVEYNPKNKTEFKIISDPNPKSVDIHVSISSENIKKELGEDRYKDRIAANWVKYLEIGFKQFYRKKYISFVGDAWKTDLQGANYIYRHLNDALMGLRTAELSNGKKIQNNIEYGYPFVGVSVLSGKKMESSWMDVAMGYGEEEKKSTPKTKGNDPNEKQNAKKYAYREITPQEIKVGTKIIEVLDKIKKSTKKAGLGEDNRYYWKKENPIAYLQPNGGKLKTIKITKLIIRKEFDNETARVEEKIQGYKLGFESAYNETGSKCDALISIIRCDPSFKIKAGNDDKSEESDEKPTSDNEPPLDLSEDEVKRGEKIIKVLDKLKKYAKKYKRKNGRFQYHWDDAPPIAFLRTKNNNSHVMRVWCLTEIKTTPAEKLSIYEKLKTYQLQFTSTYPAKSSDPIAEKSHFLIDIIKHDPTFNIISEDQYEKRREHSVETSKKRPNLYG